MRRAPERDLYSIIGVTADATAQGIRAAYLARTRVIHPDRFDRQEQPQDWMNANEMLRELNEAYSILRNPATRQQYDDLRAGKQQTQSAAPHPRPQRDPEPPPPPAFVLSELTPGQAVFGSLPKNVQGRLLERQQNKGQDQLQVNLSSLVWNYIFVAVLLCWYWYLFAAADGAKWKGDMLLWYGGITLAVGGLIGFNCVSICKWAKAKLKPYFYVTPIYFLKTDFDIVSFWPIWKLKDVAVTHNYTNGSYKNSDVILKFDGHNESLSLSSTEQVTALFDRVRTYDARLRTAYANGDQSYFLKNDDFHRVPRRVDPTNVLLSKGKQALIYVASVSMCAIGLTGAIAANEHFARKRWVRHAIPPTHLSQPVPQRVVSTPYAPQPMPYSGTVRISTTTERVAPFEIKAALGSHYLLKLVDAYTYSPVMTVFVRGGTTVEVEVPLGTYEVRYASGETWYGYEYLFGPESSYSKADKTFTFAVVGNQVSGFTITLYKVANGNLHTSAIRPTQF